MSVSALVLAAVLPLQPALADQIAADGRTATSVASHGSVTDISTQTVAGAHGVNTYARFDVSAGQTVNIHVPQGAAGTINIVNGPRSTIDGAMRSVLAGGTAGGALYFANTNGVVVGPSGRIDAGNVSISAPSRAFTEGFIGPDGAPSAAHVDSLLQGTAPRGEGDIEVRGTVAGSERVRLSTGGRVIVSGRISAGERTATLNEAVNTGGIDISADAGVLIEGSARIDGMQGAAGGDVQIRSSGTIHVAGGAEIRADAIGSGDAGVAIVFGGDAALLDAGALISASALGDGDGGFVELSAIETVELAGTLRAASAGGQAGTILIDPAIYTQRTDLIDNTGALIQITATQKVIVSAGVTISTRVITPPAGRPITAADMLTGPSNGASGDLIISAPQIEIEPGVNLLTFATGGFRGGDILLAAQHDDSAPASALPGILPETTASVEIRNAFLRGRDITVDLDVSKSNLVTSTSAVTDYAAALTDGTRLAFLDNLFSGKLAQADGLLAGVTTRQDVAGMPAYTGGFAHVSIEGSSLVSGRDVSITADTVLTQQIAPLVQALSVAAVGSAAEARIVIDGSPIIAGNLVTVTANTTETVDLNAYAGNTASGTADGSNAAAAISARWNTTEVVVNAAPAADGSAGAAIDAGGAVVLRAKSLKDISVEALVAADAQGRGEALAVSYDDSTVRVALGGAVVTDDARLNMVAETGIDRMLTRAFVGATANPTQIPAVGTVANDVLSNWIGAANTTLSGALGAVNSALAGTTTASIAASDHSLATLAQFGGRIGFENPLSGAQSTLGAAAFDPGAGNSARLNVRAITDVAGLGHASAVRLGNSSNAGSAVIVALGSDVWRTQTEAEIGSLARVESGALTLVEAQTIFPDVDTDLLRARQQDVRDAFDAPQDFELIPVAYQSPAQSDLFPDDAITHLTDVQVATPGGASVAINGGRRNAEFVTRAEVIGGATFAGGAVDTLTVTAGAAGGLLARRLLPADWRDTAAGTRGAGGMTELVTLEAVTQARVGALGTDDGTVPTEFLDIAVAAANDLVLVAGGASYGEARDFSFNGALVNASYDGTAEALFDARNFITVPVLAIDAAENGIIAAEGAAGALGGASGVGVAFVRANAYRAAQSSYAPADGSSPGLDTSLEPGTITVLAVTSAVDGISIASASAGAKSTDEAGGATGGGPPDFAAWEGDSSVDLGGNGAAQGGVINVQAAADFAWVDETNIASAITDSTRRNRSEIIGILADDTSMALMGAGAAMSGSGTIGLGGAIARLDSDRTVEARMLNGGWRVESSPSALASYNIRATDSSVQRALGFGRAGDTPGGSTIFGSVAWLISDSTVTALMDHASGTVPFIEVSALREGGAIASGGAFDRENDPDGGEPAETQARNGVGVGIGIAVMNISETVQADLVLPPKLAADRVSVAARNQSRNLGLATSQGAGQGFTVAGSAIRAVLDQTTRAGVEGRLFKPTAATDFFDRGRVTLGSFALLPEFEVTAVNDSALKAWTGTDAGAEQVAFGGSAIWVEDNRSTLVDLDLLLTEAADPDNPPDYVVQAIHRGSLDVGQRAGAGDDGGTAGEISASIVTTDWQTRVTLNDSGLSQAGSIEVSALESARLTNIQRAMSTADKGAGTFGLLATTYGSEVEIELLAAGLDTQSDYSGAEVQQGPITVTALSDSTVRAKAVRSGEGKATGAGVFNEMRSEGGTFVTLDTGLYRGFDFQFDAGSNIFGGDIVVSATDSTWREVVASAAGTADAAGVVGAITHDVYQRDTITTIGDGAFGNMTGKASPDRIGAYSDTRTTAIAVGRANGGAKIGLALVGVLAKDDRDVVAQSTVRMPFTGAETGDANGLIEARRSDILLAMQATEMVAAAGAGAGIGTVLTGGRTAATAHVRDFSIINGTLDILAEDATKSFNLALGAGEASTIGGSAAVSYMRLGRPSDAAAALADSERGSADRTTAEAGRDLLGGAITARRGNTGLFTTSAQEITARLSVSGDADYTQSGTVNISALDNRRGYAVAGQLQAGIVGAAGQFIDKHFELNSINASGFEITIMPFGNGEKDDDETGDEIDTTTPEESSEELEDAKDIADTAAGIGGNATALGAAIGYLRLGGLVEAVLDVAPINLARDFGPAHQDFSGTFMLSARSDAFTAAMGAGAVISTGNAGSATAAITRQYQQVRARVIGGGSVTPRDPGFSEPVIELDAVTSGKSWAIAAQATLGLGGAAAGATLAVNDFDAITETEILGTEISAGQQAGHVSLSARNDSDVLASGLAGGGGSNVAVGLSVGYAGNRGLTAARISGATINRLVGTTPVSVTASNTLTLTSLLAQGNIGGTAGVGAALSVAKMTGETTADIIDSTIGPSALQARLPGGGDVTVRATSDAGLGAAAVGVAGGGSAGVSGSVAITDRADTVRAEIARSRVLVMGDITVDAQATGTFGAAGGGNPAILSALRQANGNFTGSGTAAVGATVAITKAASSVQARITGSERIEAGGSIAVTARADNKARGLTLTMGGAGSVAASVQVPVFLMETEATAEIDGTSAANPVDVLAGDAILVTAHTDAEIRSFALTAAGGGAVGAGVDVEYLRTGGMTLARLRNARVEAGGDIDLEADTQTTLVTNSFAGGGGGAVGLAGIVQVALLESETNALVEAADVDIDGDLSIKATADTTVAQVSGQLAIAGSAGLGGNVIVLNGRDIVRAEVVDAAGPVSPGRSVLDIGGATRITAAATTTVDSAVYGIAGGTVGITATILVTRFEQTVTARLGDHAEMAGDSLSVRAEQGFDQTVNIGAIGGGFVGIGASIGANSMANSVLAEIGRGAAVDVTGDVDVAASGARDFTGTSVGITGGAFAFSGSILSISYGKAGESEETGAHMNRVSGSMENEDPYQSGGADMANGDAGVSAYFDAARDGRSRLDLDRLQDEATAGRDEIIARVGDGARVEAGDSITVEARESGEVSVTAGSGAGGIVGATAGIVNMRRGSTITSELGAAAELIAGEDIEIAAVADVDSDAARAAPLAFTGAGGLVAVAGAVSRVVSERALNVLVGEDARITADDKVTLRVDETALTRANAVGGAGGAIAVGGTVAFARHGSTLDIDLATGTRPQIDASRVLIEARRDGQVRATATAAQAAAIGVSGVDTTAQDDARATIDLGRLDIDAAGGSVEILVKNGAEVAARSTGVTVAGIAAQLVMASARRTAQSVIRSPQSVRIDAGDLDIVALDALSENGRSTVDARTNSIAGGIAGSAGGAITDTSIESLVEIDLILREFDISGDARIAALGRSGLSGRSTGLTSGTAAFGANVSRLSDNSQTLVNLRLDQDAIGDLDVTGTLTVEAITDQDTDNDVSSGQGGVVGLSAALVQTDIDTVTRTTIESTDASTLFAGNFVGHAEHALTHAAKGDSFSALVAGAGGTAILNTVDTDIDLTFDGINLETESIAVTIVADLTKDARRFDGQIGSVGVFTGSALLSETRFDADMDLVVLDSDLTQTTPGARATEGASFEVRGSYSGEDALKIDSGGAVTGAAAVSDIHADASGSILFDNSNIRTDGDLTAQVITDADLDTEVFVNTYGLAGVPTGDAFATLDAVQTISVVNGARLESGEADVNLAVTGGEIDIDSEIRVFNGTAVPITIQPDAESRLDMVNTILTEQGTQVNGAQDVFLTASEGDANLYSYGISSDYYREVTEDVVNFFGDIVGADDVSLATEVGRSTRAARHLVTLNGSVTAGSRHIQRLVVNADGSIFVADDGVDFEVIPDFDPADALRTYIAVLEAELENSADSAFIVQRQAAIARLEQLIADLDGETIDLLRVNDVFASGGNVLVDAEVLSGTGRITANGDALIEILNNSRAHVEVGDMLIPFRNGGELFLRGSSVNSNSVIDSFNLAGSAAKPVYNANPPGSASFALDIDGPGGADPTINIENRYIGTQAGLTGDLVVSGVIENLTGTARLLTADGNLYVFGEVNARTVDIRSGGDFFLVAAIDDYLTNIDNPIGVYADYFADIEAAQPGNCGFGGDACVIPFNEIQGEGTILGIGSVYIYANALNLNGKIQSGVTDWDLEISEGFDDFFDTLSPVDEVSTVYVPPGIDGHGSTFGNWTDPATGQPYVTGNGILRFDRVNRHFIVDPMITKGGTVELVGDIISTGGGEILAADGFGRVNVMSHVDLPVHFNAVSTGFGEDGVAGLIRIIDTARPGVTPGTFVTTEFRRNADGDIVRTTQNNQSGTGLGVAIPGQTTAQYAIEGDWAVENRVGTSIERTFTETYERVLDGNGNVISEGLVGGLPISTSDPATEEPVLTTTPTLWDDRTLISYVTLLGGNPADFSATPTYEYVAASSLPELDSARDENGLLLSQTATDWAFHSVRVVPPDVLTVERRTESRRYRWPEYALHTIPANLPIDIGFHGHDVAELNITTRGDAIFTGGVYNRGGQTEIIATDGAIVTNSPSVVFDTNRLILNAGDEIGQRVQLVGAGSFDGDFGAGGLSGRLPASIAPIKIDVADGFAFTALAGDRIRAEEISGDMEIIAVDSASRASVELIADGGIRRHANAPEGISFVNAGELTLDANGGAIGNAASLAPLWIESTRITASAAGEIALYQSGSDLNVNTITSASDNVTVVVSGGAIRDANTFRRIDERAEAGLLEALWDELGLRDRAFADGTPNTRDTDALQGYEQVRTAEYFNYWRHRVADPAAIPGGKAVVLPYDPGFRVEFDSARVAQLTAAGLDAAAIAAAEDAETVAFHAAHAVWGKDPLDAGFAYSATPAESSDILDTAFLRTEQLGLGLRRSLILPVTDTVTDLETANITGRNVNLLADVDIGEQIAPQVFLNSGGFTEEARLALWTAERADLTILPGQSFTVQRNEDLDVEASGHLQAIAGGDVFVGSETPVRLQTLFAGDNARLKTAGGITGQLTPGMLVNATGRTIILEGGDGGIGAPGAPILVAQDAAGSIAARAAGDVRLATARDSLRAAEVFDPLTLLTTVLAPQVQSLFTPDTSGISTISDRGSLAVSEIFSEGDVVLTALGGDITDANDNAAADIRAQNFLLTAGGSIGAPNRRLGIAPTGPEASVNALANAGDIDLTVTEGDVVASAILSVQGDVRLGVEAGDLRLSGSGGIAAIGAGDGLALTVSGTITGRDGVALDLQATGISTIAAGGDIGAVPTPLVTRFTDPILGTGNDAILGVFDIDPNDATPVSAWFINDGDITLSAIGLDPSASVFGLINNGSVTIDNPFFFTPDAVLTLAADRIGIAALGNSETLGKATLTIEENIAFDGGSLDLAAHGRIRVAQDKFLTLGGTVAFRGEGLRMENSGPLTIAGAGSLSVTTEREIWTGNIAAPDAAVTLRASDPSFGFVQTGDLTADTAVVSGFFIEAGQITARTIDLEADFGLLASRLVAGESLVATAFAIGEPGAPVTIESNPALETVELDGSFSLDLSVEGGPIAFDLLRTGFNDTGIRDDLIASGLLDLAALGVGPEGFGVNITAADPVTLKGRGIESNGAAVVLSASQIDLDAQVETVGGAVTFTSRQGSIRQLAGMRIASESGRILLDSAGDIELASAVSAATGDAVTLRATGSLSGVGTGPFVQMPDPAGRLTLEVGRLLSPGPLGFTVQAPRLAAEVQAGPLQIRALGDVQAELLRTGDGRVELFATGDMALNGPVESGIAASPAPVVLTALGAISVAKVPSLLAGDLYLHAFGGGVDTGPLVLGFDALKVDRWHVGAAEGIRIDLGSAGMGAEYIISETGPVTLILGAPSTIERLAADSLDVTGAPVSVTTTLQPGEQVQTLPSLPDIVSPGQYRDMALAGAGGDTGGGDAGGGDTGGGDTGGGDTGGGDTGGGDTGGGDTGGGDTGGGDTGGGDTGGGDTGGGDTGGGDTGGGDTGGGDTGGGDTGDGDSGDGETGGGLFDSQVAGSAPFTGGLPTGFSVTGMFSSGLGGVPGLAGLRPSVRIGFGEPDEDEDETDGSE